MSASTDTSTDTNTTAIEFEVGAHDRRIIPKLDDRAKALEDLQAREAPQEADEVSAGDEERVVQAQLAQASSHACRHSHTWRRKLGAEQGDVARREEPLGAEEGEGGHRAEGGAESRVYEGDVRV